MITFCYLRIAFANFVILDLKSQLSSHAHHGGSSGLTSFRNKTKNLKKIALLC